MDYTTIVNLSNHDSRTSYYLSLMTMKKLPLYALSYLLQLPVLWLVLDGVEVNFGVSGLPNIGISLIFLILFNFGDLLYSFTKES